MTSTNLSPKTNGAPRAPAPGAGSGHLVVRGMTKRFGQVVAVDDITLDLPPGSFFSLLGPSGCGKTTLLRIIAGLETADAGSVLVDGADITGTPPERRPFNMVFQRYALFPHLTVFDNVAFGLTTTRRERPTKAEITRRVTEMLELVGLGGFEKRWPSQLSGGQGQRVAVGRALIRRPKVLLLDEPLAALDRNVRHQVREELLRIHIELGTTFLFVTHDQDEALSISGIVGLMNNGKLEQLADPETLYHRPATLFAARFIGAGSFLGGKVLARRDDAVDLDCEGIRFAAANAGASEGQRVSVLLRPEDLDLVAPGAGRLDGSVATCAFFGSYYEVTVQTERGVLRLRHRTAASPGRSVGIGWGETAGIAYGATELEAASEAEADSEERAISAQ
jgi:ABC-type Fe3+/spermidine/putrescine transport system ATPase subunit